MLIHRNSANLTNRRSRQRNKLKQFFGRIKKKRQHILIVGFSPRTGLATAKIFSQYGIHYSISEQSVASPSQIQQLKRLHAHATPPQRVFIGKKQSPAQLKGITDIILSPGVPRTHSLLHAAKEQGIVIWNDIDFFYPLLKNKKIIAVTGTDGKTSSVLLIAHILRGIRKVLVGGNIGIPIASLIPKLAGLASSDVLILELSSYMLEDIKQFRCNTALITNLAEDHLDRYPSVAAYQQSKLNILNFMRGKDTFLCNLNSAPIRKKIKKNPYHTSFQMRNFSVVKTETTTSTLAQAEKAETNSRKNTLEKISDFLLLEKHSDSKTGQKNLKNTGSFFLSKTKPLFAMPLRLGLTSKVSVKQSGESGEISKKKPLFINSSTLLASLAASFLHLPAKQRRQKDFFLRRLNLFTAPAHRMQVVKTRHADIMAINDSKATTLQAVENALAFFSAQQKQHVRLILGGQDKNLDFRVLQKQLKDVKLIYLYGESAEKIKRVLVAKQALSKVRPSKSSLKTKINVCPLFADAVLLAWQDAKKTLLLRDLSNKYPEIILLSPGCASFDQFKSYEQRGEAFAAILRKAL